MEFSVSRLEALGEGDLFFWTFTLRECLPVLEARKAWNKALTYIRRALPDFCGVRVFELHPGGHGLHVHVVTNSRFAVQVIRKALKRTGWGRIHVKRIKRSKRKNLAAYLAKYLGKAGRPRCLKGWRLWAPFGPWQHCRCKDVEWDSTPRRIFNWLMENYLGWETLSWWDKCRLQQVVLGNYYMREDVNFVRDKDSGAVHLVVAPRGPCKFCQPLLL